MERRERGDEENRVYSSDIKKKTNTGQIKVSYRAGSPPGSVGRFFEAPSGQGAAAGQIDIIYKHERDLLHDSGAYA